MKITIRKRLTALLLALVLTAVLAVPAAAANGGSLSGVTEEMENAAYWQEKTGSDGNSVWLTADEIDTVNQQTADASGTMVFDLVNYSAVSNADSLRQTLSDIEVPTRDLYVNGEKIDNAAYFGAISDAVRNTAWTGESHENSYAVAVSIAAIRAVPTDDVIGYSADDSDDEYMSDSLLVGEPFLIRQKCESGGKLFYWGVARDLTGWVSADDLAVCADKDEWLDAWQVDTDGKDFIVVTQNQITTALSITCPNTAGRTLTLGTVLKLVPDEDLPVQLGERNGWYNYVVWLPVRQSDGSYAKEAALISQHYSVSVGFLPLTENNLLEVAFACLGDRYGWGNMLNAMDCSGYTRRVYACFGLCLPRNTTWQQKVPGAYLSLDGLTDAEKLQVLQELPVGSCLYFPGHTMLLVGFEDGMPCVISATGSLSDSEGELEVKSTYTVILNPLNVRRRSGNTWLSELDGAVVLRPFEKISDCTVSVQKTAGGPLVTVSDGEKLLEEGKDYTVSCSDTSVTVLGCGSYLGAQTAEIPRYADVSLTDACWPAVEWAAEQGIADGTDDLHFSPDRACTRAQVVTMLWRAAGSPETEAGEPFEDVSESDWFYNAVCWACQLGLTTGTDASHFSPRAVCTRAQMLTLVYRGLGSPEVSLEDLPADVAETSFCAAAACYAVETGLLSREENLQPGAVCTRADLVNALYQAMQPGEIVEE